MTLKELLIMVLSFVGMVFLWGMMTHSYEFAFVFLVLLAIHESGHYFAALQLKIKVTAPIFTPIGALIGIKERPANALAESFMGYAGPAAGTAAALVAHVVGVIIDDPICVAAANWAFYLNLFNLIPFSPMDGGRICVAIDYRLSFVGVIMLFAVFLFGFERSLLNLVLFVFVLHMGLGEIQNNVAMAKTKPEHFAVSPGVRAAIIAAYLGLAALLGYMTFSDRIPALLNYARQWIG